MEVSMKDKEVFEALGGQQDENLRPRECPIKSLEDKSLVDENGECEQWDREIRYKTSRGEGKVNSYYPANYDEHFNNLVACAVLAVASTKKVNSKE